MAISSPLKSKIPKSSTTTVKKFQTILFNRTRVKKEIFQNKTILQNRRVENERRVQAEEELEAPDIAVKRGGPAQLIAGSAKGFFERILGFLGYVTAGWIINNLPTWISMGKEFIARTRQMGKILGNFIKNTTDILKNFTGLLGASLTNIIKFDFLDTSGRVGTAFEELQLSVDNWGNGFEDAIKLITTPLTEGIASGEDARPTGTQNTDEGAYERTAPYSGTPAPQVMLEGGISGTTALLPFGAKGADRNIGATDRFGYSSSRGKQHNGIDIGTTGQRGYYVAFLLDGTATLNNQPGIGAGNYVEIKSGGTTYKFFHLARFSIKSGPYKAGTAIGEIGNTGTKGRAIDIHLHYEVWPPGTSGVNPEPYVNLIKIGKNLGKPTPAPASVASSSTSQPQQTLMGTSSSSSSSGSGRFGTKEEIALNDAISFAEGTKSSYGTMFGGGISKDLESGKLTVKQVIDLGDAHAKKNGQSGAAGRYQFMPPTLEDLVRTGDLKMDDKFTPQMQDKASIALARRRKVTSELLKKEGLSAKVSNMLAPEWASFPTYSGASYHGQPVKSLSSIQSAYKNSLGSPQQPAPAQTSSPTTTKSTKQPAQTQSSPTQAQITPTGTQQNTQVNQSLTPERRGQTVIIAQNPSQPQQQTMSYGGGGSSGGGSSSQTNEFSLLNIFMKNKLLLDLAYL
jgi:muramidase (phage lysozyme)